MEKIIAVAGRPGLYEIQTQTRVGVIANSLIDGKRIVTQPSDQVSVLSDIQIYSYSGEVPLPEVMLKMQEKEANGLTVVKPKAGSSALQSFFEQVLPDYDTARVYSSDIKKILQWYLLLQQSNRLPVKSEKVNKSGLSDQ